MGARGRSAPARPCGGGLYVERAGRTRVANGASHPQPAEARAADKAPESGPGAWFVKTGCSACHSIAALGVKSAAQVGPDLSIAVEDVQSRFGRTVEEFLAEPTGTMSLVLAGQITLTPEQRTIAVQHLHDAFREYQRLKAEGRAPALNGGQ